MKALRIQLSVMAVLLSTYALSAQYAPDASMKALMFILPKQAWLLTPSVQDTMRFCAAVNLDGSLRGCVTAKELRVKAEKERVEGK